MAISGRLVLLAAAGAVLVLLFPGSGAIWLWVLLLSAAVAADLLTAASPRALTLTRTVPAGVRLTEPAPAVLTVRNTGGRALRGSFRDGWQPSAGARNPVQRLRIPAGEARRFEVQLMPERRGELHSKCVTVRSFGPLGLAARQRTLQSPAVLLVLPPFHAKRHLPSKLRRLRELDGNASVQLRGAGTEFDSLRDYVRGDDVRSIDWRATARRRDTVVRTWRPERDRRVVLLLDTSRTSAARIADEPRLDTGIEAALLLAMLAHGGADRVDFLAFDRRIRARVQSGARGNLLNRLVTAVAPLEAELIEADFTLVPGAVQSVSTRRSLVVLITALDSGAIEEGLLPVLPQLLDKHVVVIASVRDPELEELRRQRTTATETFRAAAAERALLDRAAVTAQLRSMGAEVVDETPHELPPKLADLYIRLKATGRL
ncbi:DUF58 domain-containing protein [Arthrobacter sp. zg-Y820]|uniref:DUF58 domain-containing protein n=1 Tax=unclassified Arthrobacter TaxID=235627 RepID=UPI001E48F583|nr:MULTISPECIES: DUF58 domain-containing protein [unclassified Arthrobacter]MCC9195973.1 DUF58 domain-containing protein [Arthrobacter sp. zg-Y820]MDK1278832.1 DUF58 domain-containing protein [Arthrobacter sp. zg.Y820]WIB08752.1 DUF58 domain-containing protein [Arthrobacter sp. zg-Y820]